MTVSITGVHPYAEKFPMLGEAELAELAESIAENGLRNPIVLTPDGLILDGRNRSAACERAGVSPTTIVYEGDDLAEYVIDCNSSRRHMSTGARAMATALVLSEDGRRGEGRWRRGTVNQISDLSDGCHAPASRVRDAPRFQGSWETRCMLKGEPQTQNSPDLFWSELRP